MLQSVAPMAAPSRDGNYLAEFEFERTTVDSKLFDSPSGTVASESNSFLDITPPTSPQDADSISVSSRSSSRVSGHIKPIHPSHLLAAGSPTRKSFDSIERPSSSRGRKQTTPPVPPLPTASATYNRRPSPLSLHPHRDESSQDAHSSPTTAQTSIFPRRKDSLPSSASRPEADTYPSPVSPPLPDKLLPTLPPLNTGNSVIPQSRGRPRGSTIATTNGPLPRERILRSATSIPELVGRPTPRRDLSDMYKPERGPHARESYQSSTLRDTSLRGRVGYGDEFRSSFRSAWTTSSSNFQSGTERSSVLTRSSSVSDLSRHRLTGMATEEGGMSVEDAIGMYARGFHDDSEVEDMPSHADEGYASQQLSQAVAQTPTPESKAGDKSELTAERDEDQGSRESVVSAEATDATTAPSSQNFLLPATSHHVRSSTRIIAGDTEPRSRSQDYMAEDKVPRDRYGFKKATQYVTLEQYDAWDKQYTAYVERRRAKWYLLMSSYGLTRENPYRFPLKTDKVKRYVRKGIPPEWRGAAWWWWAGGPKRLAESKGLYWELVERINQGELNDSDREHIERDLHRTFPDNIRFRPEKTAATDSMYSANDRDSSLNPGISEPTPILNALRRVLQAFAIHNPNIGYCQSLNFLAGLLLLFMDENEEQAFIMLNIITNEYLPGTHGKILEANVDIGVLMTGIRESMPHVWAKINDTQDQTSGSAHVTTASARLPTVSLATTSWFMSLFVSNLPIETVLRVWDVLFFEGSKTLFRIALAIFKVGEPDIRAITDQMEIFQVVQGIPRRLLDANLLMETCYKRRNGFGHLSQETIDARRTEGRTAHVNDMARINGLPPPPPPPPSDETRRPNALQRATSRARIKRSLSRRRPRREPTV